MRYVFMLIWVVLLIFGIAFASLNAHTVFVDIFVTSVHIFLPILLLTVLAIGAFCGVLAMYPKIVKAKYANRKLRKKIKQLEKEKQQYQSDKAIKELQQV